MNFSLRFLRKRMPYDECGFALPFALILLSVTAIFTFAGLWLTESLLQRVEMRIDTLHARNLAHAGVAMEIARLEGGKSPAAMRYQNSDGTCQMAGVKVTGSTATYLISASALTTTGARSTATVYIDMFRQRVTKWSQSP